MTNKEIYVNWIGDETPIQFMRRLNMRSVVSSVTKHLSKGLGGELKTEYENLTFDMQKEIFTGCEQYIKKVIFGDDDTQNMKTIK